MCQDFTRDERVIQMFRQAERRRKWYHRLNWGPITGAMICMASASIVVTFFVYAYIWASRWYR